MIRTIIDHLNGTWIMNLPMSDKHGLITSIYYCVASLARLNNILYTCMINLNKHFEVKKYYIVSIYQ